MARGNDKLYSKQTAYNAASNVVLALGQAGVLTTADEAKEHLESIAKSIYEDLAPLAQESAPTREAKPKAGEAEYGDNPGEAPFGFGKYKGKTIQEVYEENPDYLEWCASNNKWGLVNKFMDTVKAGV